MPENREKQWHSLGVEEVIGNLQTDTQTGLRDGEVQKRQTEYGKNQLTEAPGRSILSMIYDQVSGPLTLVLLIAGLISGLVGEFEDTVVILAIVVLNAVLGVFQENKAEQSLSALRKLSAPAARVVRGGQTKDLPASELVPGDVILLEAGASVPADARLVEAANLKCEEAALTGESVPVDKTTERIDDEQAGIGDRENMVFASTTVTYGRGTAIVVATGMGTEIGKIAGMLQSTQQEPTPLQRRMEELGKLLGWFALALVVLVFIAGLLRKEPPFEMFMTSIGLAVAAIPEGLPTIVTIVLALGVQRMIKRNAIIRKLPAVETLGTATVIASDKTGTLTQNQMTVARAFVNGESVDVSGQGYEPKGEFTIGGETPSHELDHALSLLLTAGALANDAKLEKSETGYNMVGDPTEGALVVAAEKAGLIARELNKEWKRVAELPFDSQRKRMTTFHQVPGKHHFAEVLNGDIVAFTKGGPDVLLELCTHHYRDEKIVPLSDSDKESLLQVNLSMAEEALRVLGVAFRSWDSVPAQDQLTPESAETDLVFIGFAGMIDPPRPEAREAVREAKTAGIRPMMVTGDHKATAMAIAKDLGIMETGDVVISGAELESIADEELAEKIKHTAVFARVSPEHKVRIVEALRSNRQIVAMTGDGVNDAPALKRADIGAAMGITGTDVAKQAADMVLLDDNFATIVTAVKEGRTIYANIQRAIQYLLSCNVGEIVAIFAAIMLGLGRPLTAIQILWVNLVTDGLPALALGVEPPEPGVMDRPPRDPKAGVFSGGLGVLIGLQGAMIGVLTLIGYYWALTSGRSVEVARTVAFGVLAFSQLVHSFNVRTRNRPLLKVGFFGNTWLNHAFLASGLLQLAVLSIPAVEPIFDVVPLGWTEAEVIALLATVPLLLGELTKWLFRRS